VRTIRKTARLIKPVPKYTAATKAATVKPNKKAPASVKTVAAKPNNMVVTPQPPTSAIKDISELLDNLPLQPRVEVILRLLISIPSLPSGVARTRDILKTVIVFVDEYGSTT
jgi:predicted metallopeptidase